VSELFAERQHPLSRGSMQQPKKTKQVSQCAAADVEKTWQRDRKLFGSGV